MVFGVRRRGDGLWVPLGTHLFAGSVCGGERPGEEAGAGLWGDTSCRENQEGPVAGQKTYQV